VGEVWGNPLCALKAKGESRMKRVYAFVIGLVFLAAAPGMANADPTTRTPAHQQAINSVIARGLAQRGVPYTYGGGNVAGPSRGVPPAPEVTTDPANSGVTGLSTTPGLNLVPAPAPVTPGTGLLTGTAPAQIDPGADVVGFDASGLIQYAFAGVGIKLPRSSGEQYKVGRKIPPSLALPGDLIFFGPEGTQSVALFLGNGQMLEATTPAVTVSPVRTATMTPYLTRIIE
jgi:cell wall-associated NlpC family hydrolase